MTNLKLYNTLTRKKEDFSPIKGKTVGLYTCGPTVYNYAHIGNLRTYIFEDTLRRVLAYNGFKVKHVMNITDVGHLTSDADDGEDKLEKGAKREGKSVWDIAEFYTKEFQKNLVDLNIIEPSIWCRATDYIKHQIKFVEELEKKGFTYITSDGVYFDTSRYSDYHRLGNLNLSGQKEGARVEANEEKKNPTDFALWKFSPVGSKREMEWKSPWGVGFPGWHLECSAMSIEHLGQEFDIHAGGIDHIPIHHTNERAQNWGLTGKETVKRWMHGEFLVIDKDRMGKSEGNFITLQTLIDKKFNPLAYRYLNLQTHYRQKLNFSWESLAAAEQGLFNLYDEVLTYGQPKNGCKEYEDKFFKAINDDLNIPQALAVVWELVKDSNFSPADKKQSLLKFDEVLGLGFNKLKQEKIPDDVMKLAQNRQRARENKDFSKSDELRDKITTHGYVVEDTAEGFIIKKKR